MPAKSKSAIMVAVVSFAGILFTISALAQNVPAVSLAERLRTQYKLAKLSPDSNIMEPGTVLVIQTGGIVGVPPGSAYSCPSTYLDGALHTPSADDKLHCGKEIRELNTGERVYPLKLDVDSRKDRVSLLIVECGSCNGVPQSASYKSQIVFQYPSGYLAAAEEGQIEDVISRILMLESEYNKSSENPPPAQSQNLINGDIIKLVQAKLPDSVVIAKIKSSSCDFDTSPDALIKLKRAGVSDAVLQAIVEAPPPTPPPPPAEDTGAVPPIVAACNDYVSCIAAGKTALGASQWDDAIATFQKASTLDASKPDAWAGMGNAYLGAARNEEAAAMWDKALTAGGPLKFAACHIRAFNTCEFGNLVLGPKNVSFALTAGQELFAALPSQVLSPRAFQYAATEGQPSPQIVVLSLKAAGKNYRFHVIPFGVACNTGPQVVRVVCPDEGSSQALVISNYISQALPNLASGTIGSSPK